MAAFSVQNTMSSIVYYTLTTPLEAPVVVTVISNIEDDVQYSSVVYGYYRLSIYSLLGLNFLDFLYLYVFLLLKLLLMGASYSYSMMYL